MKRLTRRDWEIIATCLNMVAAGIWDDGSYGERPDIEAVEDKVAERLSAASPKRS